MSDILSRPVPTKGNRVQYGREPLQFGELRFPRGPGPSPLLFVIHGGFWSSSYDLSHISHLCESLTSRGIVTCSLEYRRVGNSGGGWPGTFLDVAAAADFFRQNLMKDPRVDLAKAAVIGHSAGGHLAFWLGGQQNVPEGSVLHAEKKPWLGAVISLAGVVDLRAAWDLRLGNGAARRLIGGDPQQYPERYDEASPIELLPMKVKQVLIHGRDDEIVPISQSERFVERARAAGDEPLLVALDGIGHFELIDPESQAWNSVAQATISVFENR
jgi:acetyl esterase/lipase